MITLKSFPQGDNLSKYYAVNNPIVYTFEATGKGSGAYNVYSFLAENIGAGPNNTIINIATDVTKVMRQGDIIVIGYSEIRNVVSLQFIQAQNRTVVTIDEPTLIANNVPIDSINNYRAEFRIFHGRKEVDGLGNLIMQQVGVNITGTSNVDGIIKLNIQPYLKSFIDLQNLKNISKINSVDRGLWGRFTVQYRERFDGDGVAPEQSWVPGTIELANMRWYISGVKQIKSRGAGSMFPFVKTGVTSPGDPRIEFTTAFAEPEYYVGYPNEVSFIWPEIGGGYNFLKVRQQKLDSGKNVTATTDTVLFTEGRQEVNRLRIGNYTSAGFVRLSLIEDVEPSEGYVQAGYVIEGYFELI